MSFSAIILSDTHGRRDRIRDVLDRAFSQSKKPDAIFFLGDTEADLDCLTERERGLLYAVRGNCDVFSSLPDVLTVDAGGVKLLLCHGHTYGVKSGVERLFFASRERGVNAALFGHTHSPYLETSGGITLFNPGSLSSRSDGYPSFGTLEVRDGVMLFSHGKA